jgi:hypothetical protein
MLLSCVVVVDGVLGFCLLSSGFPHCIVLYIYFLGKKSFGYFVSPYH